MDKKNILAFPQPYGLPDHQIGMTLLDYFAGQALTAMLSNSQLTNQLALMVGDGKQPAEEVSVGAYTYAEAMLAEKQRREGNV